MEFLHMSKELNVLSDWVLSTLVPNGEEFLRMCGQEDRVVKKAWEGRGPTEWRCDLAHGVSNDSH